MIQIKSPTNNNPTSGYQLGGTNCTAEVTSFERSNQADPETGRASGHEFTDKESQCADDTDYDSDPDAEPEPDLSSHPDSE